MTDKTAAWLMMGIGTAQVLLLLAMLATLRDAGMQKPRSRPRISDRLFGLVGLVGVMMSALDDALARFTAFVKDVVGQLTATKDTNDAQTGKIAELQAALDAALSDDASDKAAINALQAEIAGLQDSVAAQIDATLDALANPPVEEVPAPVEEPVVVVVDEPVVVVDEPVVDEPVVVVDEPVVEETVVEETVSDDLVVVEDETTTS